MRNSLLIICLLLFLPVLSCYPSGTEESLTTEETTPEGSVEVRFLTDQLVCITADYSDFLIDQVRTHYGKDLSRLDTRLIPVPGWSYDKQYTEAMESVINHWRPVISSRYQETGAFSVSGGIDILESSYWVEAIAQMKFPYMVNEGEHDAGSARVAHFAYLHLSSPMVSGQEYTVTNGFGESVSFIYEEEEVLSYALKVNQVGYLPDAGEKYGYLGIWAGTGGAVELDDFIGREFYLIDEVSGESVYTGIVTKRSDPSYHNDKYGEELPIDGEYIYELDFSSFDQDGEYHLYLPGAGCSWSFRVSDDAIGYAFYTHARGLYHQRSGISKESPYTEWEMGAGHRDTYQGGFAPNDTHYRTSDETYGFYDEDGEHTRFSAFRMVESTATDTLLPDVWGGWYDAGDFDRRMYHFSIVEDLLTTYLMYPQKFTDSQLDIPESGNGIPDIIDEAAWGIDVWLRAQDDSGGVGCWIEADSHPHIFDPADDTQPYYLAMPTRESSLTYSAYAALLALALDEAGFPEQAERYVDSAEAAFSYALEPANLAETTFTYEKQQYTYREPAELDTVDLFHAASVLKILTDDRGYEEFLSDAYFDLADDWYYSSERSTRFQYVYLFGDHFPESWADRIAVKTIGYADDLLESQQELGYRTVNWPVDHGFFQFMAWGRGLPYYKGRALTAAMRITGEQRYYDAALLLVDWMSGANPQGRSMTTGLGETAPVKVLSLPAMADGIEEPFPGITPFTYTGSVANQSSGLVYGLEDEGTFIPLLSGFDDISFEEYSDSLDALIPIYRRHSTLEHLIVDQNEFTVWETISPAAAFTACLLPDGWMPAGDWSQREPVDDLSQLSGYIPQP